MGCADANNQGPFPDTPHTQMQHALVSSLRYCMWSAPSPDESLEATFITCLGFGCFRGRPDPEHRGSGYR